VLLFLFCHVPFNLPFFIGHVPVSYFIFTCCYISHLLENGPHYFITCEDRTNSLASCLDESNARRAQVGRSIQL